MVALLATENSSLPHKKSEKHCFQPKVVERKNVYTASEYIAICKKIDEIN